MAPEGWKNKLIKEVTTWNSGGTPSMRKKSYWNGDIPWISASTMQCHVFETSTKFITKEGLKSGSKLAAKNSLLLLVRGSMLWNKIPVGIAKRDLAFNQDVKSVTANSLLLPLFCVFQSKPATHSTGSLPPIPFESCHPFQANLPPTEGVTI